jgi:hypothetical protein
VIRLLLAALLVAACSAPVEPSPSPTDPAVTPTITPTPTLDPRPGRSAALESAAATWTSTGYVAYSFTLERTCFCLEAARGPWTATVLDTSVLLVDAAGNEPDEALIGEIPRTIDELFAFLRMRLDADGFEVTYDPVTGAPLTVAIDPSTAMADEEIGFVISDLAPYTIDQ